MVLISPRIQFFEIHDQSWCPNYLRERVQSTLAFFWNFRVPLIQKTCPAHLLASIIYKTLGDKVTQYHYVDFCAGAGGPTLEVERFLNKRILNLSQESSRKSQVNSTKYGSPARFTLTDLHPHINDWTIAAKRSENINFVSEPVDAANAPALLNGVDQKIFRLYNLSFHHFDDRLGSNILRDTLEKSDGFGLFELQHRTVSSIITVLVSGILLFFISPFYFWRYPGHLFFTYIIPIIPFIVVFDGLVSSLRTRTTEEISALIKGSGASTEGWGIFAGEVQHTWPTGYMTWVIALKRDSEKNI